MTATGKERDAFSGTETTGHDWDGLKELNNPAPRWWLLIFLLTVVWAIGYWVAYPVRAVKRGETSGFLQWSSTAQLAKDRAVIEARRAKYAANFETLSLDQIRHTPEFYQFARAGGQALFKENCAPCHGSGAAGRKGFPNLNDDDWLWGGTLNDVYTTIQHGIRSNDPQTRNNLMPNFGADGILKPAQIELVISHVERLAGRKIAGSDAAIAMGAKLFAENCSSCHGAEGKGNSQLGAPNLTDAIWLYGGRREDIQASVWRAHAGVMPAWAGRLPESSLKQLAIYIHSLGGVREQPQPTPQTVATNPPK